MPLVCEGVTFPRNPVMTARVRRLLRNGTYELKEARALRDLIRSGDRILELGGGLGYLSAKARQFGASEVTVVEANPELVQYIKQQHAVNKIASTTILHGLVDMKDAPGKKIHLRKNFLASSARADIHPERIETSVLVPCLGINQLIDRSQPDVLICDIEGAEVDVLSAADLTGLRSAVVELHPQWIGSTGVAAVFDAFSRAGMTYCAKGSHGKVVVFERAIPNEAA